MEELIDQKPDDWRLKTFHTNRMDHVRHFFVDGFLIATASFIIDMKLANTFQTFTLFEKVGFLLFGVAMFIYYVIFEYFFQITPGKFLNNTKVVTMKGNKPSFMQIVYRSMIRIFPITIISLILPDKLTLHDMLSQTYTVRKPKLKAQNSKADF